MKCWNLQAWLLCIYNSVILHSVNENKTLPVYTFMCRVISVSNESDLDWSTEVRYLQYLGRLF
jgi:hypothetical protein